MGARLSRGVTVEVLKSAARLWRRTVFFARHRHLRKVRKILFALLPPPTWSNVGDHAQVIAIQEWISRHFPGVPVVEVDKNGTLEFVPELRRIVGPEDLILLQSGGNLGDRGVWSESGRRAIIEAFPDNVIVSLPQTVFFSDSDEGRRQRAMSTAIYAAHPRLTLVARDPRSADLIQEYFPAARLLRAPDMVLSLPPLTAPAAGSSGKLLVCLRLDNESALGDEGRRQVRRVLPADVDDVDSVTRYPIRSQDRRRVLDHILRRFRAARAVITDRYHGLVFSVLCRTPVVVLPSVDHKIGSGMEWLKDVPFARLVRKPEDVPEALERALRGAGAHVPDWTATYFDPLARDLRLPKWLDDRRR